jgi:hypothetical protein
VPARHRVIAGLGGYYLASGIAPFASRRAFEAVTGPKQEWWLVQTVGALVTVAGAAMVSSAARRRVTPEIVGLSAGCAATLTAIDVIYVARGRIRPTYLLDAAVEVAALAALAAGRDPDG